ncbi:MAG TPA: peptidylprolyl isomerase, partial [Adhaeribacter sp.]|nr:peptidylprolyl isomerase [Adhaeribacter sp.]
AATAFASLQEKTAVPQLTALLTDPVANVRKAAAYALGQTADAAAENALLTAIDQESDRPARAEMFEALGKVATGKGLAILTNFDTSDSLIKAGQAWALYRAQLKGPLPETAYGKLVNFLSAGNSRPVRLAAANTLARSGKTDLSRFRVQLQSALQQEKWYPVRSALASTLGKVNTPEATETLNLLAAQDPDYRVRVSAFRAMKEHATINKAVLIKGLQDPDMHVRLTAAEIIAARNLETPETLQHLATEQTDWRTQAVLFGAALKNTKDQTSLQTELINRFNKSTNRYEKGALLQALSNSATAYDFLVEQTFNSSDLVIKTYGIEALATLRKAPGFPDAQKKPFAEMLKRAINSSDAALIGVAAGLMREPDLNFREVYNDLTFLETAKTNLTLPRDVEPYLELQKTVAFLEGKPEPAAPRSTNPHPINWNLVQTLSPVQKVRIKTSKGTIVMVLNVEEAPGSVANFVELINAGFYNGRSIHRVVPNFVAQDGCPRGDGWGSTDYNIRSEFNDLAYREGTVGMASAGKDTESCQWFITHAPVPHLEGRYTIFAQVVAGLEIVHRLQIGDKIETVELVP